jgi:hypothetical protein
MIAVLAVAMVACEGSAPPASSFAIPPGTTVVTPEMTGEAVESSSSSSSTSTSSTGPAPEDSTSDAPGTTGTTRAVGTSEPAPDLGLPDLGDPHPIGCKGKIDFLFVISRMGFMEAMQTRLVEAFPHFIATIESKFADFDYHIMVVDGDDTWGSEQCNVDCQTCPYPGYPCQAVASQTPCDNTMGAGTVFPAGKAASNKNCGIVGGNRYLTRDQPDLAGTFACLGKVGLSGHMRLGEAAVAAVSPQLNQAGGCNAGFIRDDALLMVTFVFNGADTFSQGTPKQWADAIAAAKHGDFDSVVMFSISEPNCTPWDTVCDLVKYFFPYWHIVDHEEPDYIEGFEVATDLVYEACSLFTPQ